MNVKRTVATVLATTALLTAGATTAHAGNDWTRVERMASTVLELPQAALDHGNAPSRNPNAGPDATPVLAGSRWGSVTLDRQDGSAWK